MPASRLVGRSVPPWIPAAVGPPPSNFGTSIPASIPVSTGTHYYVANAGGGGSDSNDGSIGSPWLTIQHAFDTVSTNGSVINLRGGTHTADVSDITWSRTGNSGNPVTLRGYPGESAILDGSRILITSTGSYLRIEGFETGNGANDGIKADGGSHHWHVDRMVIRDTTFQGILIGGGGVASSDFQIWNTRIIDPGTHGEPDQHAIYFSSTAGVNVVANCLFYSYDGYGLHWYSESADTGATTHVLNCTVNRTTGTDGGPATFSLTSIDVRMRGCILTDSVGAYEAIRIWNTVESTTVVADCIGFDVASPAFPTVTQGSDPWGGTYTNTSTSDPLYVNAATNDYHLQNGSPAINFCSARPEWVPPTDIDGTARVTADAGCFAKV